MDWEINPCWTDMGLFTGYCSVRSTETLLKSPPGLMLPRDILNAGDRNSALRTSLPRWIWHGQKAVMLENLGFINHNRKSMPLNVNSRFKTLALSWLLETFSVQVLRSIYQYLLSTHWLPMTRWMFHPDFSRCIHHISFKDVYLQNNIVWKHRAVCQFWTEYSSYHTKFCVIYLPICLNLISQVFELASCNFLYLVWFFERPFCDESSVNTKCSISRRNNAAWFSTESHFASFIIASVSLYQFSTTPQIPSLQDKGRRCCGYFQVLCASGFSCWLPSWLLLTRAL